MEQQDICGPNSAPTKLAVMNVLLDTKIDVTLIKRTQVLTFECKLEGEASSGRYELNVGGIILILYNEQKNYSIRIGDDGSANITINLDKES